MQFAGDESARRKSLLKKITEAVENKVDFIQLREKDLCARDLQLLAAKAVQLIQPPTRLLVNSRIDVALAAGAAGVHLRANDISPADARNIWCGAGAPAREKPRPLIAVSCHMPAEASCATDQGVDFAVFAPVFEKKGTTPAGLDQLHAACQFKIPVLALGGVTLSNAQSCLEAGAAGIAGIRLFQESTLAETVSALRALSQ